jgi:predicted nuclease of restriction endonuclease-like (RecB) superfamily
MPKTTKRLTNHNYPLFSKEIITLIESARHRAARSINSILTATYWEIGRRIVEYTQKGSQRAAYGEKWVVRLSKDLTAVFGKGFSPDNIERMRKFYLKYRNLSISATPSRKFNLSWSHYVSLLSRTNSDAEYAFYEREAVRGGWSIRQLHRQINSKYFDRYCISKNKAALKEKNTATLQSIKTTSEEIIKDPYVLEFLNLDDGFKENELEAALVNHLETFLLELGNDFTFVGRQKKMRLDTAWYFVDLIMFHRKLKCLVLIELKTRELRPADIGQMHMYLNYASDQWTSEDENPPIGLILCTGKNHSVAKYALSGLPHQVHTADYTLQLPNEKLLAREIDKTRKLLENRKLLKPKTI